MSEVRGKYITLAGSLMSLYPKQRTEADTMLFAQTGKHFNELEPEGWYDTKWVKLFLDKYAEASLSGDNALKTFGRRIYPTIKAGLPSHLKTTLDFLKFETEGYMHAHRGPDVKPRTIIKANEGEFIVQAIVPQWHNSKMYEGVFLGILEMCGNKDGKVTRKPVPEKGDNIVEFHISW
jgi:hypothetical protein